MSGVTQTGKKNQKIFWSSQKKNPKQKKSEGIEFAS